MTRDDIIRMAKEAGLLRAGAGWTEPHRWGRSEIERFAELVAAHERDECVKVLELDDSMRWSGAADAIRARGNSK